MWDLIVSVPDHCLSFYFDRHKSRTSSNSGQIVLLTLELLAL